MTELKRGDKVRVEYEGVVSNYIPGTSKCWDVIVSLPDGTSTYVRREHVTVIESAYEAGSIYRDALGIDFLRRRNPRAPWHGVVANVDYDEQVPRRPLRKLVPEDAASE